MKYLHPRVVFVGDRPNPKRNLDLAVPFVGTLSYKRLLDWIYRMNIDIRNVDMLNAFDVRGNPVNLLDCCPDLRQCAVIALGNDAANQLKNIPGLRYFTLPHPSGANPNANKSKRLYEYLARAQKFIYTHSQSI